MTATFNQVAMKIIREQELVIGPLAWSEAKKVRGLTIDMSSGNVAVAEDDSKGTIDRLVAKYERLFGRASEEVCREAVANMLADFAPADIPMSLRA